MQKNLGRTVKVPFRNLFSIVLTAGVNSSRLAAATLSGRCASLCDNFALYRVNKYRFRIHPTVLASETMVIAFVPDIVDTTPTFTNVTESNFLAVLGLQCTIPSEWCTVPQNVLRGAIPWYKSVQGTTTDWEECFGTMLYASTNASSTATIWWELEGEIEFSGAEDPGITPADRAASAMHRERERILRILASEQTKILVQPQAARGASAASVPTTGRSVRDKALP